MRIIPALLGLGLLAAGCSGTKVGMYDGEESCSNDGGKTFVRCETGSVAVINDETGEDIALLDQAYSRSSAGKKRARIKNVSSDQLNKRYGSLLAGMPERPRLFILYFQNDSTELIEESKALVPALFAEVARRPGVDVQIVGHTDSMGAEGYNAELSIQRAVEVQAELAKLGLDSRIVRTTGRGEYEPLEGPYRDEFSAAQNKRVEVFVK